MSWPKWQYCLQPEEIAWPYLAIQWYCLTISYYSKKWPHHIWLFQESNWPDLIIQYLTVSGVILLVMEIVWCYLASHGNCLEIFYCSRIFSYHITYNSTKGPVHILLIRKITWQFHGHFLLSKESAWPYFIFPVKCVALPNYWRKVSGNILLFVKPTSPYLIIQGKCLAISYYSKKLPGQPSSFFSQNQNTGFVSWVGQIKILCILKFWEF